MQTPAVQPGIAMSPFARVAHDPSRIRVPNPLTDVSRDVELSARGRQAHTQHTAVRTILGGIARELSSAELMQPGVAPPSRYLKDQTGPDLSPEATAERILVGITGPIYEAFRRQHPDATRADFDYFQQEVMRGFERGLREARAILEGMEALDAELEPEIGRTEKLVRDGLARFFEEEAQSYT